MPIRHFVFRELKNDEVGSIQQITDLRNKVRLVSLLEACVTESGEAPQAQRARQEHILTSWDVLNFLGSCVAGQGETFPDLSMRCYSIGGQR